MVIDIMTVVHLQVYSIPLGGMCVRQPFAIGGWLWVTLCRAIHLGHWNSWLHARVCNGVV